MNHHSRAQASLHLLVAGLRPASQPWARRVRLHLIPAFQSPLRGALFPLHFTLQMGKRSLIEATTLAPNLLQLGRSGT